MTTAVEWPAAAAGAAGSRPTRRLTGKAGDVGEVAETGSMEANVSTGTNSADTLGYETSASTENGSDEDAKPVPSPSPSPPPSLGREREMDVSVGADYVRERANQYPPPHAYLCLDIEATCNGSYTQGSGGNGTARIFEQNFENEILELPVEAVCAKTGRLLTTEHPGWAFHTYVNPVIKPSKFCTELTGIDENTLKRAPPLGEALRRLEVQCPMLYPTPTLTSFHPPPPPSPATQQPPHRAGCAAATSSLGRWRTRRTGS